MQKNNGSKKRWVSTVLLTGVILAGMMPVGAVVNAVSRDDSTVSMQESGQLANDQKSGFEKITADVDAQKVKEDSVAVTDKEEVVTEDKTTSTAKDEDIAKAKEESSSTKDKKVSTNKKSKVVPTASYVGPTTRAINTDWDTSKDYANESATAYVSPSGLQGKKNEPVLYFGNTTFAFQPSALTNNNNYNRDTNPSSWAYTTGKETNPNPRKSYGIIINGNVPGDRGYGFSTPTGSTSIENNVGKTPSDKNKINGYHLYKNKAGTGFKAIMYDTTYKLSYTFEEMYDADGGIYSYFSITNNESVSRDIGAVEGVDTFVDSDAVPVRSIGVGEGFKMVGTTHTLNFRLNDPNGNAKLGGWTNYTAGNVQETEKIKTTILGVSDVAQFFNNGILGAGMENTKSGVDIGIYNIKKPDEILAGPLPEDTDSGFVIKANPKSLAPGETLTNGSYLTYKEVKPSTPPVATVTSPATLNAYADQTAALTIKGKVSDVDSTKGRIKLTYGDGSTAETNYDTGTVGKSIDYSAAIDASKLKLGANKVIVTAIDDSDFEQLNPVTVTVNLFKLGATPLAQTIKVGETVSTDEAKLVNNIKIMNGNSHTLVIDGKNPSNKPLDNKIPGFYIQDMTLTDITTSPKEVVNVPIPVNVKDDDTVIDTTSAVYAKSFSAKVADLPILAGGTKLNDWILKTSEAKGWMVATGAESKVSVKSTTLTVTSVGGVYKAVIQNSNGKEITINITITGGDLKITSAPDTMNYGATSGVMLPYSAENFNLQRQDNSKAKVSISNAGQQGWNLTAKVSKPLTNGTNTLKGVLKYVDTSNAATDLDSGSVTVGSGVATQDVTWDAKQGIIANLNGNNTSLKAGKYTGEITWTLTDAPLP